MLRCGGEICGSEMLVRGGVGWVWGGGWGGGGGGGVGKGGVSAKLEGGEEGRCYLLSIFQALSIRGDSFGIQRQKPGTF